MSFDKFAWLKAVYADPTFPPGEKAVLAYVAVFSVLQGESSFRVRQSTLADAAHSGISRQTVGEAIRRAKRLGYLLVVSPHAPGRGSHTAELLQLFLPAKSKASLPNSGKQTARAAKSKGALPDSAASESCKANGPNGVKQTAESCKAASPSTSENGTLTSSLTSSISPGTGSETAHATTEEQEQLHAPGGAGLDEKTTRPWFSGGVHKVLASTNIDRAGSRPPPKRNGVIPGNGVVREKLDPWVERIAGNGECELCDDDGYLADDAQCWHGKKPPA